MERKIMMMRKKRRKRRIRRTITTISLLVCLLLVGALFKAIAGKDNKDNKFVNVFGLLGKESKNGITVAIDPGHGGYDIGAVKYITEKEKEINLAVALELGAMLEKNNINVVYTRKNDEVPWPSNEKLDLKERCEISNNAKADIFISIHCNSDNDTKIRGVETWIKDSDPKSKELGEYIQENLEAHNYTEGRGLKTQKDRDIYVLKMTKATAVLVEIGYISNSSDNEFITSQEGVKKISQAIGEGILKFNTKKE